MPRRILARRFEPRYGVSQSMLETEAKYIARELEDYLLMSTNDLRSKLAERQTIIDSSEKELESRIGGLPDRERTALRAMLARDFFHIAALYCQAIKASAPAEATGPGESAPAELERDQEPLIMPFKQCLFD